MIKKLVCCLITVLIVGGCTSTNSANNTEYIRYDSQESVYRDTKEYGKLVDLYKERLVAEESSSTRIKLAKTYIEMGDIESAEFTLNTMPITGNFGGEVDYLFALINYDKEYYGSSLIYAKTAVEKNSKFEEAQNLIGLIYATLGDYRNARHYFHLARQNYANDVKIKNNLAMVDILEGDYKNAAYRLEPLVTNGSTDSQVLANLSLVYAKMDNWQSFLAVNSGSNKSVADLTTAFNELSQSTLVTATTPSRLN